METVSGGAGERRERAHRRVKRPGAVGADPAPLSERPGDEPPVRAAEDTDAAWGDRPRGNDERLKRDVPPHW